MRPNTPLGLRPGTDVPHVLILAYSDGSGIQATWGPYPSEAAARQGQKDLGEWPIESGKWEIRPLLTPLRNVPAGPVYRTPIGTVTLTA